MKRNFLLLASLLLLTMRLWGADTVSPLAKPVEFDTHDGYFVSNQFEAKAATSFVVIKDQAAFDKVFGVGMVMGDKHHRLPAAASTVPSSPTITAPMGTSPRSAAARASRSAWSMGEALVGLLISVKIALNGSA